MTNAKGDLSKKIERLEDLSPHEYKAFEQSARRLAKQQGLQLKRSRRRAAQGQYWLLDPVRNFDMAGDQFGMNLAEVVVWLIEAKKNTCS